jgi:hypothetical protein
LQTGGNNRGGRRRMSRYEDEMAETGRKRTEQDADSMDFIFDQKLIKSDIIIQLVERIELLEAMRK